MVLCIADGTRFKSALGTVISLDGTLEQCSSAAGRLGTSIKMVLLLKFRVKPSLGQVFASWRQLDELDFVSRSREGLIFLSNEDVDSD